MNPGVRVPYFDTCGYMRHLRTCASSGRSQNLLEHTTTSTRELPREHWSAAAAANETQFRSEGVREAIRRARLMRLNSEYHLRASHTLSGQYARLRAA